NVYNSLAVFLGRAQPVPISEPLRSFFTPTSSEITTIEVAIGTYGRKNPGILELQVLDQEDRLLESSQVAGSDLANNSNCQFHFSKIKDVRGKRLKLVLTFQLDSKESIVAAYVPPDASYIGFAFRVVPADQDFHLAFRDQETGVAVWENPAATPRVFFAPEVLTASSPEEALSRLKDVPNLTRVVLVEDGGQTWQSQDPNQPAGFLREFHLSSNEVSIAYNANQPGILTLVDSFSPGWRAEVNGQEVPVIRVDGVFRGVRIDTPAELAVRFWYRPPHCTVSLRLCRLGFVILALTLLSGRCRRPRNSKNPVNPAGTSSSAV